MRPSPPPCPSPSSIQIRNLQSAHSAQGTGAKVGALRKRTFRKEKRRRGTDLARIPPTLKSFSEKKELGRRGILFLQTRYPVPPYFCFPFLPLFSSPPLFLCMGYRDHFPPPPTSSYSQASQPGWKRKRQCSKLVAIVQLAR